MFYFSEARQQRVSDRTGFPLPLCRISESFQIVFTSRGAEQVIVLNVRWLARWASALSIVLTSRGAEKVMVLKVRWLARWASAFQLCSPPMELSTPSPFPRASLFCSLCKELNNVFKVKCSFLHDTWCS